MKKPRIFFWILLRSGLLGLFFLIVFCGQLTFSLGESFSADLKGARVLEIEGVVQSKMFGEKTRLLAPGDFIRIGEELKISGDSWVSLAMADSTVRKFDGPATITIEEDLRKTGGGILARLGSAVVGVLFSQEQEKPEAVMTTRRVEGVEDKSYLPLLVHPAPGSGVLEEPAEFKWRKVEGVPLYRVSVYSSDRILWQGTTSDSHIHCPSEHCDFTPGEQYYWVVEGLVGNSALRSKAADFKVVPPAAKSEIYEALAQTDSTCPDPDLAIMVKIRLCLNLNLYHKALELFDSYWKERSFDRRAYTLRAEIKEKMGLFEDALFDYRNASSMPSIK